jgi:2-polyprenyl-3-methyl-5-hydroxy-6-metoxy-1,4-benzoquinol methylase
MENIKDDRGFNQVWADKRSTRVRAGRRCNYMISQMQVGPLKKVMEIGCGTGLNAMMLCNRTGMEVLGTDLCVPFIEQARKNNRHSNLRYEILDFNKADQFKGETFDYIVGNGILHHLYHHLDDAFTNMKKLLKPGGKIIFIEPNLYNPYVYLIFSYPFLRKLTHLEPDEMAFTKSFITEKLSKAGYSNIKVDYKDFLLPGIPDFLINPSVLIGDVLEKLPLVNKVSQSIFITAEN